MKPITFRTASGEEYHLEIDHLNSNILTAGSPGRIRKIEKYLDDVGIEEGDRGLVVIQGKYRGMPISAFPTGMGPASAAIVIPEAIEAVQGSVTMLRLGTAGALQPFIKVGDIVISSGSIRDEATTRAAVGPEFPAYADPELIPVMIAVAAEYGHELGDNLWTGITHVKDDLYFKETPMFSPSRELMEPKLKSYRRMGALASSMEFSTYSIMRDFYEGRREGRILVGEMLGIIAKVEEGGPIEVDEDKKEGLETAMIEIGLETLVAVDKLRNGKEVDLDLSNIIAKMIQAPPRFELSRD